MINKEDVNKAILRHAKGKLKTCSECKQKTLEVTTGYEYYDQLVYWYRCLYCGYTNRSGWTEPLHGRFFKNKYEKDKDSS